MKIVEVKDGYDHRWTREETTIIKIGNRYFALPWRAALTELQDNEFYDQPYEVVKKEKTIVVNEYVPIT